MNEPVYLDYNATAPMPADVAEAMLAAARLVGNPSSVHAFGRAARRALEAARSDVATLVNAHPEHLVFTSGAAEANALALRGCGRERIIISAIEHPSVLEAVERPEVIPVGPDGIVDLGALEALLDGSSEPTLVSVMLANNETGVVQPVKEVVAMTHHAGALVHCDAVQAPGRMPLDMEALGTDMLTLSAHKMGGPKGVGCLILRNDIRLAPMLRGGGQERGRRSGTENLPGVAGFAAAARRARQNLERAPAVASLRDQLEARARQCAPRTVVIGEAAPRLPNTSCLALPGVKAETLVMALDLAGVAVSAGSACSSGKVRRSHVLVAMGCDPALADSAIRVSIGPETTEAEIERFLAAWSETASRLRRSAA